VPEVFLREALAGGCAPELVRGRLKRREVLPQEEGYVEAGALEHMDNVLSSKGGGNTLPRLAHERHSSLLW